ncbi:MAG: AAA family ATPase [Clostridia bacterium]|nr:AAA family ATPase [Clostridia bacterium]
MIIALSGDTGAGKSTLSRILKQKLDARVLTVGYILRAQAKAKNMIFEDYLREIESLYGKSAHMKVLEKDIKSKLKKHSTVIVEGTYKVEDLVALQRLFPKEVMLNFHVESDRKIRIKRIMKRKSLNRSEAIDWVNMQDKVRAERFNMNDVAVIAGDKIINKGLTRKELYEAFEKQYNKKMFVKLIDTLKNRRRRL